MTQPQTSERERHEALGRGVGGPISSSFEEMLPHIFCYIRSSGENSHPKCIVLISIP